MIESSGFATRRLRLQILVLLLISACSSTPEYETSKEVTELDVTIEDLLVLGADENASSDSLFMYPIHVVSDSRGRIYVADQGFVQVKVFSSSGEFLRTLGQRGSAPGEFERIAGMSITKDGTLLILDRNNGRITTFNIDNETKDTIEFGIRHFSVFSEMNGGYLVLSKPWDLESKTNGNLFKMYSSDLLNLIHEFAPYSDVIDTTSAIEHMVLTIDPGSFILYGEGVLYAPKLYKGQLLKYYQYEDGWRLDGHLKGQTFRDTYTLTDEPNSLNSDIVSSTGSSIVWGAKLHNRSLGLYRLSTEEIVHFTFVEKGDSRILNMELFTEDGELKATGILAEKALSREGIAFIPWNIAWKDSKDRFYIIDLEETPVVRVVRLIY